MGFRKQELERRASLKKELLSSGHWKQHPKHKYLISKCGKVFSLLTYRERKHWITKTNYASISVGGINSLVHRLVLETWVGPCKNNKQGAHLDGNPSNNNLDNLKWVTAKENCSHKKIHGTNLQGSTHPLSILIERDIPVIKRLRELGMTLEKISKIFGVNISTINLVIKGKTWNHLNK